MNQIKKLRPLVQLVPAVAVAAIVLVTLPRTLPVLAEVPERLSPAVSSSAAVEEPEPEEEDILPTLPYEDGVYTGSSRGYGGTVRVQVTMEGGHITDLQILDASHETSAFLRRARRLLTTVLTAQTWEVDAVSEATYTSRGILGAIQNALTGEVVNNPLPPKQETPEPIVEEPFEAPSAYRDGVYTASAQGFGGPITVQVTVQNDTITDISILSHDGETTSYFARARKVVSEILTTGTPDVDSVSGATYSSTGILNAVKRALAKAAVDAEPVEEPAETPVTEPQGDAAEPEGTHLCGRRVHRHRRKHPRTGDGLGHRDGRPGGGGHHRADPDRTGRKILLGKGKGCLEDAGLRQAGRCRYRRRLLSGRGAGRRHSGCPEAGTVRRGGL